MADIIDINGKKAITQDVQPKVDVGTFEFKLNLPDKDGGFLVESGKGFLVITSTFAAIGRGEGEIVKMVPMSNIVSVTRTGD